MKTPNTKLAGAVGAALTAALASAPVSADANPFGLVELAGGYMLATAAGAHPEHDGEKESEGKCGEGRCGEGRCGSHGDDAEDADESEEKADAEGKCGEGKCGEGRCGAA